MAAGSWSYAYCITQVVQQVANRNLADVRFHAHQDVLMEYMAARNLPNSLKTRLLMFYEFQRKHAAVFNKCALCINFYNGTLAKQLHPQRAPETAVTYMQGRGHLAGLAAPFACGGQGACEQGDC